MVGHKVYYHLQTCFVCALYERFEFVHSLFYVSRRVWVDVVVIGYGIRASRISFHHSRMLPWYSVSGIVCCCGVSYHSCIPHVCGAKLLYSAQHSWSECVEFTASVVRQRTVVFPCCIRVSEQSCEDLVDYSFFHKFSVLCKFTYYFQIIARSRYKKRAIGEKPMTPYAV